MHLLNHVQWRRFGCSSFDFGGENCEPSSLSLSSCSQVDASTEVCFENFGIRLRLEARLHFGNEKHLVTLTWGLPKVGVGEGWLWLGEG